MYQLNNLFYGELDLSGGDITSGATTITLSAGDVANLEITPTATDPALFTIWDKSYEHAGAARRDGGKVEIIEVTGKDQANDTLTAGTRGFSNTTAQSYNSSDNTTFGIVQVSADELFDSLLIAGTSNKIQDRSGTTLDTINAATNFQLAGSDIFDSGTAALTAVGSTSGSVSVGSHPWYRVQDSITIFVDFAADLSGLSGNVDLNGLPFTVGVQGVSVFTHGNSVSYPTGTTTLLARADEASTTIELIGQGDSGGFLRLQGSDIADSSGYVMTITYERS